MAKKKGGGLTAAAKTLGSKGGKEGGPARAKALTAAERIAIAALNDRCVPIPATIFADRTFAPIRSTPRDTLLPYSFGVAVVIHMRHAVHIQTPTVHGTILSFDIVVRLLLLPVVDPPSMCAGTPVPQVAGT